MSLPSDAWCKYSPDELQELFHGDLLQNNPWKNSSCTSERGSSKSIIEGADLPDVAAMTGVSNWVGTM